MQPYHPCLKADVDRSLFHRMAICCLGALALAVLRPITSADAHAAPSGWIYPFECCGDRDCRPVHDPEIRESPHGYVIGHTGEIVGYGDRRLRNSPDGEYHLCEIPGQAHPHAVCLFVPQRAS
jgi:hypothetical protein